MSWQQIYLHYDQDALILYANVGLVRRARKDVEANKVELIEQNNDLLRFSVDEQQVILSEQGIQNANCNCVAKGHCRHIIAAILWLQINNNFIKDSTTHIITNQDDVKQHANQLTDALTELLSLDVISLQKSIGKANLRLAYQLVTNWQDQNNVSVDLWSSKIQFRVPESHSPIIYLAGAGFAGMISDLPNKQQKIVHLAVIAYLFQQHQKPWQWLYESDVIQTKTDQLSVDEIVLIQQIETQIFVLIKHGLSHVSHSQAKQIQLLNVSAKSQGLPSLAAMLRQLCQLVEQLAEQHFTVEEQDLLVLLARLKAYLQMLLSNQGEQLTFLRGGHKRHYQKQQKTLQLLPLGADWWQSKTGAIGISCYFWDVEQQQYYQTTLGRPNTNDNNFNRMQIWNSLSIWQSMPSVLMAKSIKLHNPRFANDNILASSGSTVTLLEQGWDEKNYQDFRSQVGFQDWALLANYLQSHNFNNVLLDEVLFIHITSSVKPELDEIRQSLVWCVQDKHNNQLFLRLFWDQTHLRRFEAFNRFFKSSNQPLTVLVKCVINETYLDLVPFALLYKKAADINLLCLDFENSKLNTGSFLTKTVANLKSLPIDQQHDMPKNYSQNAFNSLICQPVLRLLSNIISSGRSELLILHKQQLAQIQRDCDTLGFSTLSNILSKIHTCQQFEINHILQAVYVCYLMTKASYHLPIELH